MNKKDLNLLFSIATVAARRGIIELDEFVEVGATTQKLKALLMQMGDEDEMVLLKYSPAPAPDPTQNDKDNESHE